MTEASAGGLETIPRRENETMNRITCSLTAVAAIAIATTGCTSHSEKKLSMRGKIDIEAETKKMRIEEQERTYRQQQLLEELDRQILLNKAEKQIPKYRYR